MSVQLPTPDKRFIFNGSAVAFAGRIRRPDDVFIQAAAPSHLPVTGGFSEASIGTKDDKRQFVYKDLITFDTAYSSATGDFLDPKQAVEFTNNNQGLNNLPTRTSTEARLTGLKVEQLNPADATSRRTFTANLLQVQMTSTSNRRDPVSFSSLSAKFDTIQLALGGSPEAATLNVETDTDMFCRFDTMAKLVKEYSENGDFRKTYAPMLLPLGEEDKTGITGMLSAHNITYANQGLFVATIVKSLKWAGTPPAGTEILGNRLTIDGFGRIFFGEVVIEGNTRRVTLLRFELGSPDGGDSSACEVGSNGGGYPPGS